MRRIVACSVIVLAVAAALVVARLSLWVVVLGGGAIAVAAWRLTVCRHPGPLGLLPSTKALDGSVMPPRWYCDVCGATWPAHFEKPQTPVRRFTGYDESKAVNAARRAAELAERQQMLAVQRAGLRPSGTSAAAAARSTTRKSKPVSKSVATSESAAADVVSIEHGRRFAG